MDKNEAISLIESIVKSLTESPAQFHFEISASGTHITTTGRGTGLQVSVTGGGPNSNTTGYQSTLNISNSTFEIAQKRADDQISKQIYGLITQLNEIVNQLKQPHPDKDVISKIYRSFTNTWIPGVITSILGNILSKTLGIT